MTLANRFKREIEHLEVHHDSLELVDSFVAILNMIDPTAMFDLEHSLGLAIIFSDGTRAIVYGPEKH